MASFCGTDFQFEESAVRGCQNTPSIRARYFPAVKYGCKIIACNPNSTRV